MDSCGTKHRSSGKQGRSFVRRFIVPIITEYIIHPVAFTIHILISRFRCPPSVPSTFRINVEYDSILGARAPKKRRIVQINRSAPTNSVTIVRTFQEFAIEKIDNNSTSSSLSTRADFAWSHEDSKDRCSLFNHRHFTRTFAT